MFKTFIITGKTNIILPNEIHSAIFVKGLFMEIINSPIVYICENNYQIVFDSVTPGACILQVGNITFKETIAGVVRSDLRFHKFTIPIDILNREKKYTINFFSYNERKPYFPSYEKETIISRDFYPISNTTPINILVLGDVHYDLNNAFAIANAFPHFDSLALLGDLASCSNNVEDISIVLKMASTITNGEKPVIAVRGNHELRGEFAWMLPQVLPCNNNNFYYSINLDNLEILVLDAGEDKDDNHGEYGILADYSSYRQEELNYLKEFVSKSPKGSNKARIIFSHIPFPIPNTEEDGIFDIESKTYKEFVKCCNNWKTDLQISGHLHTCGIDIPSNEDIYNRKYPVLLASEFTDRFTVGSIVSINNNSIEAKLINNKGEVRETYCIEKEPS